MPFQKGQSGNPAGRPPGSRNKKTLLMEVLLEGEGEGIARNLVERALMGDSLAVKLCTERLLPTGQNRPVEFALPQFTETGGIRRAVDEVTVGVGAETLTLREGMDFARYLEKMAQVLKLSQQADATDAGPREIKFRWMNEEEAAAEARERAIEKNNETMETIKEQ